MNDLTYDFLGAVSHTIMQAKTLTEAQQFANSLTSKKLTCKRWLIEQLLKYHTPRNTLLLGAWYTTLFIDQLPGHFQAIDVDPSITHLNNIFLKRLGLSSRVSYTIIDAFDYMAIANLQKFDTIINTSCEHMQDMKDVVVPGPLYVLQSNDYRQIEEHINCKDDLQEFIESTGLQDIKYAGELTTNKYTRFMVIGRV